MVEENSPGSMPWLADLVGQAWAPQPPKLSSDRVQSLARRGMTRPEEMTPRDITEICAAVVAFGVAQSRG